MDRASDFGSEGWGFESLRARQSRWSPLEIKSSLREPSQIAGVHYISDTLSATSLSKVRTFRISTFVVDTRY